jgi:hypothetical protein
MAVWQFIHGFAGRDEPELITFYDHHDQTLYRDLPMATIGEHGWELVTAILAPDPKSNNGLRYEYFFKRRREDDTDDGVAKPKRN